MKKILLLALALSAFTITSPVTIDQARAACGDEAGENVNWEGCRKRNLVLTGSNMKQANFKGTNFSSTDMRDSEFDNSDFQKAVLLRVFFDRSSAVNANFEKAIVYRVNFKETNLENAIFQKSEMGRPRRRLPEYRSLHPLFRLASRPCSASCHFWRPGPAWLW